MRKEFSFKNYFIYAFRYWLIVAICAVLGLGAGLVSGIMLRDKEYVKYEGNVAISGVSSFFEDLSDKAEIPANLYNTIKSEALSVMRSQLVADKTYQHLGKEWRELEINKKLTVNEAKDKFYERLQVVDSSYYISVSFVQDKKTNDGFSAKAVNTYLELAKAEAVRREPMLADRVGDSPETIDSKLIISLAEERVENTLDGLGLLKGAVIGVVGGFVAAMIAMLIAYYIDKRITSYGDIAEVTGRKLLGVSKGSVSNKVCPRIDCEMSGAQVLAVCGNEETCRRLSELCGEYAASAGHKTLRIDFSCGDGSEPDTFGAYVGGAKLSECLKEENGVFVMNGTRSWALALGNGDKIEELKKQYGRVVICAPYRDDGSVGVLSKISDKTVFAVNQSKMRMPDMLGLVQEADAGEKAIGTVIEKTGRSFVGGNVYFIADEEE